MDEEDRTMRAARHLAALGAEVLAHERAAGPGATTETTYVLRAWRPGAACPTVRSCTSALRVLQMDSAFRKEGMRTEIVAQDGRRLAREELGHRACDEVMALAGRAGWGWWRRGFD